MVSAKHTPLPWHVERGTPTGRRVIAEVIDPRGLTLFRIVHDGLVDGGAEADARLIAAAPRMAELLLRFHGSAWPTTAEVETVLREAGLL